MSNKYEQVTITVFHDNRDLALADSIKMLPKGTPVQHVYQAIKFEVIEGNRKMLWKLLCPIETAEEFIDTLNETKLSPKTLPVLPIETRSVKRVLFHPGCDCIE